MIGQRRQTKIEREHESLVAQLFDTGEQPVPVHFSTEQKLIYVLIIHRETVLNV